MTETKNAIILAAGRGSRLNEMTDNKPKCLTEIAGKTLLAWQISALRQAGIEQITVIRGYLKETLTPEKTGLEFSTIDNDNWANTNMVSTLACADTVLQNSTCIISYSDIVYTWAHPQRLLTNSQPIAISYDTEWESLWRLRMAEPLADAETFIQQAGLLQEIGEKTSDITRIQGQYMGLLKISPEGWSTVSQLLNSFPPETRDRLDMTSLLSRLLQNGCSIGTTAVSGKWLEVDTVADLNAYMERLRQPDWQHDWR